MIPDAKRRLPHWSGSRRGEAVDYAILIPDAKRRLPHWSEAASCRAGREASIPDAKRRLPHWSLGVGVNRRRVDADSRRQKASASLEFLRSRTALSAILTFQTPKGVCLIGVFRMRGSRRAASCDSRRQKASASLEYCLFAGVSGPLRIPDAKRRLPHWSFVSGAASALAAVHSRRQKASASLEHIAGADDFAVLADSRRQKASASLERTGTLSALGGEGSNSRRQKASASLERALRA